MLEAFWKKIIRRKRLSLLSLPALLLWLIVPVYKVGFYIKKKFMAKPLKLSVPVISIGNITVGGTGKTPLCAQLARSFGEEGFKVGIISSGYGRTDNATYIVEGYHTNEYSAEQLGDEVIHLGKLVPDAVFAIAREKVHAAQELIKQKQVDVLLIDDGFQHFQLERDINIVTYDAAIEKRLLKPFPAGVMREPLSALKRADIIIITRAKFARDINKLKKKLTKVNPHAEHFQVRFDATHVIGKYQTLPVKYLEDKHVLLFAGIGNFESLRKQVYALCADLDESLELSDHQVYTSETLQKIKFEADDHDSDLILTTGKDWVKTENFDFGREFYYLNQTIDLDPGEEKLIRYLIESLGLQKIEN